MKTVRGVLRPAFQMAVDDDVLYKKPFGFELAGLVVNDSVTREALTRDQMRKFLKYEGNTQSFISGFMLFERISREKDEYNFLYNKKARQFNCRVSMSDNTKFHA